MDDLPPQPVDDREMLRDYLAARDVPCPLCNYNLHALKGSACPECGFEIQMENGHLKPPVIGAAYVEGIASLIGWILVFLGIAVAISVFALIGENTSVLVLFLLLVTTTMPAIIVSNKIKRSRWLRRTMASRTSLFGMFVRVATIVFFIAVFAALVLGIVIQHRY